MDLINSSEFAALPRAGCVHLGKVLIVSEPQSHYFKTGLIILTLEGHCEDYTN